MADAPLADINKEIAKLDYEALQADTAERVRIQTEFAHSVLRGLTLGNGGAIVALFTFIGNADAAARYDPPLIWWAFASYLIGLVATFAAAFGGFFAQAFYMDSSISESWTKQAEMFETGQAWDHETPYKRGELSERLGIGAAVIGLLGFAVGSGFALAGVLP